MKGFDFDVAKAEQIFDLLLEKKQLKLPESHKLPTTQELQGRLYCKWHHSFTHATNDSKILQLSTQVITPPVQLALMPDVAEIVQIIPIKCTN